MISLVVTRNVTCTLTLASYPCSTVTCTLTLASYPCSTVTCTLTLASYPCSTVTCTLTLASYPCSTVTCTLTLASYPCSTVTCTLTLASYPVSTGNVFCMLPFFFPTCKKKRWQWRLGTKLHLRQSTGGLWSCHSGCRWGRQWSGPWGQSVVSRERYTEDRAVILVLESIV